MKRTIALTILLLAICFTLAAGPTTKPYGLADRLPVQPYLNMPKSAPLAPGDWRVTQAYSNLIFQDPVNLVPAPHTKKMFVCEREGKIWCFDDDQTAKEKTLVLDLSDKTQGWDDCGMLGFAFHPDFGKADSPNRGYFYVWYNRAEDPTPGPGRPPVNKVTHDRLSRFTVPDGKTAADPKSELLLIDQEDRNVWHNGGGMLFGPDGFLYLSLGDEGGSGDQFENAQRIDRSMFSGIIRIDVDCDPTKSHKISRQPWRGTSANYFIPNDNPWVGQPNTLEEFWCVGLRNPYRITMDPVTKIIWAGDVGQDTYEEIDKIEKGGNYQWSFREGAHDFDKPRPTTMQGKEIPPYFEYPHRNQNNCIIGGYVYRGTEHKELFGLYIFGDNVSGRIWSIPTDSPNPQPTLLATLPRQAYSGLSSFGLDHAGELYFCQLGEHDGQILKLERPVTVNANTFPATLSKTGAFSDIASLSPSAGLIPYEVNSPLWSDGARKSRWVALPTGQTIQFAPTGKWVFPNGTVFVKNFDLPIDDRDPQKVRRLETRLLVRDEAGSAYGATYKWRDDNSDADLLGVAAVEEVTIATTKLIDNLIGQDVGDPTAKGSFTAVGKMGVDVIGGGADIYDKSDQFYFVNQKRKGDFDVCVRVESFTAANSFSKAGLMARQSLDANSAYAFALTYPDNSNPPHGAGYDLQSRRNTGGDAAAILPVNKNSFPNNWIRLKRQKSTFTAYSSHGQMQWTEIGSTTVPMSDDIYLGVAVTSHDAKKSATAKFRDLANLRMQSWYFPSPQDCLSCHTELAGRVLGVNARQLNGEMKYPGGEKDNQLRAWSHIGMFSNPPAENEIATIPKLVPLTDTSASLELRVRSYLDSNCAQCHLPGGAAGSFDARFETPFDQQKLIDSEVRNAAGVKKGRTIVPNDPDHSVIFRRIAAARDAKMPPLARNLRDETAIDTMRAWIKSLKPAKKPN